jgi:phage gp46-like protein
LNINISGEIGKRYTGDRKDRHVGSRIWLQREVRVSRVWRDRAEKNHNFI